MRLYFIRHGESENNLLYARTGSNDNRSDDPKMTKRGWDQARLTSLLLRDGRDLWDGEDIGTLEKGFGITHLYCSPMYRSLATGSEIAKAIGLPIHIWADWHECGGMFLENKQNGNNDPRPGMTLEEIETLFPLAIPDATIRHDGWWNRPFETHPERIVRASRVAKELLTRHGGSDDRVAVVSHGGFYVRFVAALLNWEDALPIWLRMNNTGISRFDFVDHENSMVFHNYIGHLPAQHIT